MNRKDEHIKFALDQGFIENDFDRIRFVHHSLNDTAFDEISLKTNFCGYSIDYPIFINAMTGGTNKAKEINSKLSKIARHFNIPMASGSLSIAIKNPSTIDSFKIIREINPNGIIIANIGADKNLEYAKQAVKLLNANILQIHVNPVQEMIMPEGERNFKNWISIIKDIVNNVDVEVIVKEVGFGMSKKTISILKSLNVNTIDISGRGGTNFAKIENNRRQSSMDYLNDWGLSTVESLLEATTVKNIQVIASGGIRNPLDVIKALALGANVVGMSGYFLKLVENYSIVEAIKIVEQFINELKMIMTLLGAKTIEELKNCELIVDNTLIYFMKQRNIDPIVIYKR